MMGAVALGGTAQASDLTIEATVPVEISIDGLKVAIVLTPAHLRFDVTPGAHEVMMWVDGRPHDRLVDVPIDGTVVMVAGKTGLTASTQVIPPDLGRAATLEVRSTGTEPLRVDLAGDRYVIDPGAVMAIDVIVGTHSFELRNGAGTFIWTTGSLVVGGDTVLQVSGGSMPEVLGQGSAFRPGT